MWPLALKKGWPLIRGTFKEKPVDSKEKWPYKGGSISWEGPLQKGTTPGDHCTIEYKLSGCIQPLCICDISLFVILVGSMFKITIHKIESIAQEYDF